MACVVHNVVIVMFCVTLPVAVGTTKNDPDQFGIVELHTLDSMQKNNPQPYQNIIEGLSSSGNLENRTSAHTQNKSESRNVNSNDPVTGTTMRKKGEVSVISSLVKMLGIDDTTMETEAVTGRKMKLKRMIIKMALGLKMLTLGLILPGVVALSMLQSWKAVTISLLALGLALVLGIKNIVKAASSSNSHPAPHVVHATWPSDRRRSWKTFQVEPETPIIVAHDDNYDFSSHDLAYRRYLFT